MSDQVSFQLKIGGSPASASVINALRRVEVEDHAHVADMLRLRIGVAVRQDGSGWTFLDDNLFTRLASIDLSVTLGSGNAIPLIKAYVIEVATEFSPAPNGSELAVTAMDPTVLMHLEEKVKAWPNQQDSDVASAIFSDSTYGFTPVVDSTDFSHDENDHTLMQRGTDIQFLNGLARRNGYECYVETNDAGDVEGHFHAPRQDTQPQGTLTVNMGEATNVNRFHVRYEMLAPTTAQATTIDPDDGSSPQGSSQEPEHTEDMGEAPAAPSDRPRVVLLSHLAMSQSGEVQRYAQAVVDRSSWAIVAEGELNTVAYGGVLRAKQPVMVRGVGRTFSGRYYVERVLHTITSDGSYSQRFRLRRNATGLTGQETFKDDDALAA